MVTAQALSHWALHLNPSKKVRTFRASNGSFCYDQLMEPLLSIDQKSTLFQLADKFSEYNIKFIVIGGLAAIAWGVKRKLVDIDIQVGTADFKKVEKIFAKEIIQSARHYKTEKWDIKQMIINLNGVDIDICQAEDFYVIKKGIKYLVPNSLAAASTKQVAGIEIPVLPLKELIKYKQLIARPVDMDDLSLLIRLQ
jgi:hypothetical protein